MYGIRLSIIHQVSEKTLTHQINFIIIFHQPRKLMS